jgi:hypothetical protein
MRSVPAPHELRAKDELLSGRGARYALGVRGTIGRAKTLCFPRVNGAGAGTSASSATAVGHSGNGVEVLSTEEVFSTREDEAQAERECCRERPPGTSSEPRPMP